MGGQQEINMKLYYSFDWLGRGQRACTTANAGWKTEQGFILQEFYVGVKYSQGTEITQDGQSWPGWAGLAEQKKKKMKFPCGFLQGSEYLIGKSAEESKRIDSQRIDSHVTCKSSAEPQLYKEGVMLGMICN